MRLKYIEILIFLILLALRNSVGASTGETISTHWLIGDVAAAPEFSIAYFSSSEEISFTNIRSSVYDSLFKTELKENTGSNFGYHWVRLDFGNSLSKLKTRNKWYLNIGFSSHYPRVFLKDFQTIFKYNIDIFLDLEYRRSNRSIPKLSFTLSQLVDGRYIYIKHFVPDSYVRFKNLGKIEVEPIDYYRNNTDLLRLNFKNRYAAIAFFGFGIVMVVFSMIVYLYQGAKEFLFYGLFALCSLLYLSTGKLGIDEMIFGKNYDLYYIFLVGYQFLLYIFYYLFALNFLQFKKYYPFLFNLINLTIKFLIGLFLLFAALQLINYQYEIYLPYANWVVGFHRVVLSVVGLISMIVLLRNPHNRLVYFIVSGAAIFTMGSLLYLFLDKPDYQIYGTSAEMLIFTLGLAYKYKKSGDNLVLMEKEASELKLSALKAQMNPHFIFNSLNSIQYFVLKNDTENALNYLGKFSQMLRRVLDHSVDGHVTLDQEIELLFNYLELEKLRFENGFSFKIDVSDNIDTHNEQVPLLLIQPYVENAIKHGLLPSSALSKNLTVSFDLERERILCTVEDNGVGISLMTDSGITDFWKGRKRKSRGMTIVRERLTALDDGYSIDSITIENKLIETHGSTGTIVKIRIPRT